MAGDKGQYYSNRVKQWLVYLRQEYTEAKDIFMDIRSHKKSEPIVARLNQELEKVS